MIDKKQKLIRDIQNLLNTHEGVSKTDVNPKLLEFMNESDLKNIISCILEQKESQQDEDINWLQQFKK